MDCPKCKLSCSPKSHIPVMLVKCGHTICKTCALTLLSSHTIICPECGVPTNNIKNIEELPVNLALFSICPKVPSSHVPLCTNHGKLIEAFCQEDHQLLCIDCILSRAHKSHTILGISNSSKDERLYLQTQLCQVTDVEGRLNMLLSDIVSYKVMLGETANKKREQVTKIFKEISDAVHERESLLKQSISSLLEKEEELMDKSAEDIKLQLEKIGIYKKETEIAKTQTDYEILERVAFRKEILAAANKPLPKIACNNVFPEYSKEREITAILQVLNFPINLGKPQIPRGIDKRKAQLVNGKVLEQKKVAGPKIVHGKGKAVKQLQRKPELRKNKSILIKPEDKSEKKSTEESVNVTDDLGRSFINESPKKEVSVEGIKKPGELLAKLRINHKSLEGKHPQKIGLSPSTTSATGLSPDKLGNYEQQHTVSVFLPASKSSPEDDKFPELVPVQKVDLAGMLQVTAEQIYVLGKSFLN